MSIFIFYFSLIRIIRQFTINKYRIEMLHSCSDCGIKRPQQDADDLKDFLVA